MNLEKPDPNGWYHRKETCMTKKEFSIYETVCKEEWARLAKDGDCEKGDGICTAFIHGCPACAIAYSVISGRNEAGKEKCQYCPIKIWRGRSEDGARCQDGTNLYGQWLVAVDKKPIAKQISKLEWGWMPEYKSVVLDIPALRFLRKNGYIE